MNFPVVFAVAFAVQILCQLYKVFYYSAKDRHFSFKYFFSPGGMPSAHTAFVVSLTVAVGMRSGFASDIFAVSSVFSAIVIYDAFRLRGTVQQQSVLLNRLREKIEPGAPPLSEMVGHTLPEIVAGFIVGGVGAVGVSLLFA